MSKFSPGSIPHYFIIKTLGDFVYTNGIQISIFLKNKFILEKAILIVPRIKEVVARITPVLGSVKLDNLRWAFAATLGRFCESIVHFVANDPNKGTNDAISLSSFSSDFLPAFEIMFSNWLTSKESKVYKNR